VYGSSSAASTTGTTDAVYRSYDDIPFKCCNDGEVCSSCDGHLIWGLHDEGADKAASFLSLISSTHYTHFPGAGEEVTCNNDLFKHKKVVMRSNQYISGFASYSASTVSSF
jgi:hypothetical protein